MIGLMHFATWAFNFLFFNALFMPGIGLVIRLGLRKVRLTYKIYIALLVSILSALLALTSLKLVISKIDEDSIAHLFGFTTITWNIELLYQATLGYSLLIIAILINKWSSKIGVTVYIAAMIFFLSGLLHVYTGLFATEFILARYNISLHY